MNKKISEIIQLKLQEEPDPKYIALSSEAMQDLVREFETLNGTVKRPLISINGVKMEPYKIITDFLGFNIITEYSPEMPEDGVRIGTDHETIFAFTKFVSKETK